MSFETWILVDNTKKRYPTILENIDSVKRDSIQGGSEGNVYKITTLNGVYIEKEYPNLESFHRELSALKLLQENCKEYFSCLHSFRRPQNNSLPAIRIEYLNGFIHLYEYIQEYHISLYKKLIIAKKILLIAQKMHSLGVVSRDIKEENIMINPLSLRVVFIDFGISLTKKTKKKLYKQEENTVMGSYNSIAPEIAGNNVKNFDDVRKSDVFSIGTVFFNLFFDVELYDGIVVENFKQIADLTKECMDVRLKDIPSFPIVKETLKSKDNKIMKILIILITNMLNPVKKERWPLNKCESYFGMIKEKYIEKGLNELND